jgi:hypothetical protein
MKMLTELLQFNNRLDLFSSEGMQSAYPLGNED